MSIAKFTLTALSAAVLTLPAHAASSDVEAKGESKVQPLAFSAALKLQKTYFETSNANGAALVAGINPYGSAQAVNCPVNAGCYLIVNANAQVQGAATVNPTAIVIKVDGATINSPFNNPVGTTSFTVVSYQTGIPLAFGPHTVTTEFYSSVATTLHRYNTEIKLYK